MIRLAPRGMRDTHSFKVVWSVVLGMSTLIGMGAGGVAIWSFVAGGPEQVASTFVAIVNVTNADVGLAKVVEDLTALVEELREVVELARVLLESAGPSALLK